MLKLTIFLSLILLISQANAGIVNLAWNTGISGRTTLVAPNDTIVWTVTDSNTHTVTSDNATFFDSGFITTNFSLNTVNLSLGSYPYHCNVHSFMTGTIVITTNVSSSDTLSGTIPSPTNTKSNLPSPSISPTDSVSISLSNAAVASSVAGSSAVVAASSVVVAASSGVVAASSGGVSATGTKAAVNASLSISATHTDSISLSTVVSQSGSLAASSQVGATSTRTGSKSLSGTSSGTPSESALASAATQTQTKSGVAQSQGATPSFSLSHQSHAAVKSKTLTGLAAITCRQGCANSFISCKKTSRRLRPCRRAKKSCVANCGTVNPN